MGWRDRLDDPAVHEYAYLTIEGTPYLFTSQELPASMVPVGYEQIVCLDLSRGIEVKQSPLERKSGVASPQPFGIKLGPRNAERLLQVCAPQGASFRSKLTADFDYNDTTVPCLTAGGPTTGEYIYLGREAMKVTSVASGSFNVAGGREQLDSVQWAFRSAATKYVSDAPEIFEKRLMHLWTGFCDDAGDPLDVVLYGDNQAEVYAGQIQSLSPGDDLFSWDLRALSLEKCLDLTIGAENILGHLHVYATDSAPGGATKLGIDTWGAYVYPGQNIVHIEATDSGASASVEVLIPTGFTANLGSTIATAIGTQLNAAPGAWAGTWSAFCGIYPSSATDDNGDIQDAVASHTLQISSDDAVGPATVDVIAKPGSVLPSIGWTFNTPTEAIVAATPGQYQSAWTWDSPLNALFVAADAPSVFVFLDEPDKWGTSGFVRIGNGDDAEIAEYSAVTPFLTDTLYQLTLSKRGASGTMAKDVWVSFTGAFKSGGNGEYESGGTWVKTTEQVQVTLAAGVDDADAFTLLLSAAVSTGTPAVRGAYDIAGIPPGIGGALQDSIFNANSFIEASEVTRTLLTVRNMSWQRPMTLNSWVSQELAFLGYTLQSRRNQDGRFRLTLDRVRDPLLVSAATLVADDLSVDGKVSLRRHGVGIVNTASANVMYNPATESFDGEPWLVNDVDSQELYGKQTAISLQAKGLTQTVATARLATETQILAIMSHYSRPYETLKVSTRRNYWKYVPGNQIAVTLPILPNADGTRGWVDEPCIIIAVSSRYIGKGRSPSTTLDLLHLPSRRTTYYVPTAEVQSWAAGSKTLTLKDNTFSNAAIPYPPDPSVLSKDVRWFAENGSKFYIANEGDEANQELLTVASFNVDTSTIVTTTVPTLTPGADTVIYFPAYDDCTATQKLYFHLADANATLGAAADEAHQYTG
jgi:hypothetical protein